MYTTNDLTYLAQSLLWREFQPVLLWWDSHVTPNLYSHNPTDPIFLPVLSLLCCQALEKKVSVIHTQLSEYLSVQI